MASFTKLFSSIIHSTVWREPMPVKVVWITMLAMADQQGHISASIPGLADAARVSLPECMEALERLAEPDPFSRTKEHEGRRIEEIDGGWKLLNYTKYRELRQSEERREQTRLAVQRHRAKKADVSQNVSIGKQSKPRKAQAEAEAEADTATATDGAKRRVRSDPWRTAFAAHWRRIAGEVSDRDVATLRKLVPDCSAEQAMSAASDWVAFQKRNGKDPVFAWFRKVAAYRVKETTVLDGQLDGEELSPEAQALI